MPENAAAAGSALTDRLRFVKLDAKSPEQVRELRPIIERELPIELDTFYDQIRVTEEVRKFFRGDDHIESARNSDQSLAGDQFLHLRQRLFGAHAIGKAHSRIGLEPRWYNTSAVIP
jgi:methyl-accepting chemotaxis protein